MSNYKKNHNILKGKICLIVLTYQNNNYNYFSLHHFSDNFLSSSKAHIENFDI